MDKKQGKYWYRELDRFGLFAVGMFIGALAELTEIKTLGIIISVALLTCISILSFIIKKFVIESRSVKQ